MIIRRMTKEDAAQMACIEEAVFSQPWSKKAFEESLSYENTIFLVAEDERDGQKQILGYVGMYISFEEGEITNVAVDEASRKKGIGKALILKLLEEAAALSVTRIILEVRCSNADAIGLYTKCDFKKIGIRKGFYDFPKEDADIMLWEAAIE